MSWTRCFTERFCAEQSLVDGVSSIGCRRKTRMRSMIHILTAAFVDIWCIILLNIYLPHNPTRPKSERGFSDTSLWLNHNFEITSLRRLYGKTTCDAHTTLSYFTVIRTYSYKSTISRTSILQTCCWVCYDGECPWRLVTQGVSSRGVSRHVGTDVKRPRGLAQRNVVLPRLRLTYILPFLSYVIKLIRFTTGITRHNRKATLKLRNGMTKPRCRPYGTRSRKAQC
jgi:hypothetical protein